MAMTCEPPTSPMLTAHRANAAIATAGTLGWTSTYVPNIGIHPTWPVPYPATPCPTCGRCPTCGSHRPAPYARPYTWTATGTSTATLSDTTTMTVAPDDGGEDD